MKNSLGDSWKARAAVFASGCVMAVLSLELVLRVIGAFDYDRHASFPGGGGGAARVILCLGDSFTYGMRVRREEAYPARLQRLIDERKGEGLYRVVNGGVLGQNTAQLLAALPNEVRRYKPAAVVMLTGGSNFWNVWGYGRFREGREYSDWREKLSVLKVGRLALILAEPLRNGRFGLATLRSLWPSLRHDLGRSFSLQVLGLASEKLGRDTAALRFYARALEIDPGSARAMTAAGKACMRLERYDDAVRFFTDAARRGGDLSEIRLMLTLIRERSGDDGAAMRPGKDGPTLADGLPCWAACESQWPDAATAAGRLAGCYADCIRKEPDNHLIYYKIMRLQKDGRGGKEGLPAEVSDAMREREDLRAAYLSAGQTTEPPLGEWAGEDIKKIVRKSRAAGAAVFVMNYPNPVCGNMLLRHGFLEEFRGSPDAVFIDNEAVFCRSSRDDAPPERLFFSDSFQGKYGHCTPAGNRIVAENVFKALERSGFFGASASTEADPDRPIRP